MNQNCVSVVGDDTRNLLINQCIISYPHLFTPKAAGRPGPQNQNRPKFSANFILPEHIVWGNQTHPDVQLLAGAYHEAIRQQWPNGAPPNLKEPWKDAARAAPHLAGRIMISASTDAQFPPGVFSQHGRMAPEDQSQIFAGCIVNAHVSCKAFTTGSNGVTFYLNDVQLVDNMNVTRLDNRKDGAQVFGLPPEGMPQPQSPPPQQPGPQVPQHQQVQPGAPQQPQYQQPQPPVPVSQQPQHQSQQQQWPPATAPGGYDPNQGF